MKNLLKASPHDIARLSLMKWTPLEENRNFGPPSLYDLELKDPGVYAKLKLWGVLFFVAKLTLPTFWTQ